MAEALRGGGGLQATCGTIAGMTTDAEYMGRAFELARRAQEEGEVPVGAVLVHEGRIVGEGWNHPISSADATSHAETEAIRMACKTVGNYRIPGSTLFVTLEPCVMCSGAIMHARIGRLVFGAFDPKTGACGSVVNLFAEPRLNHHTTVTPGLMAEESAAMLRAFFAGRR